MKLRSSIFYLLCFLIGNVSVGHRNPAVLKMKTTQQKNTLYLRECNLDKLKEFIEIANQKLESKQIEK